MNLTPEQTLTLKTFILNDSTFSVLPHTLTSADIIANALSDIAAPNFWVYRQSVSRYEYITKTGPNSTIFNFAGSGGFIARSQGERDAFNLLFADTGEVNPSLDNVIAAFNDIFSGTSQGAQNNRAHLLDMSKRVATVLEKLFATGTGTFANPGKITVTGTFGFQEIMDVMSWG